MRGIISIGCGTLILMAVGFGCASGPEEKPEEVSNAAPNFTPLRTTDSLSGVEASASAAKLPLQPITRSRSTELDKNVLESLRRYDRRAWVEYKRDIRAENLAPETRDKICRRALEALVKAVLGQNELSPEDISRGLDLVEASGEREHSFAKPEGRLRELARRRRNTPKGKQVWQYINRYDLYHNHLLNGLKGCGLNASDVYWTPSFTLLNLELRGLEERYLQIIESSDWK